MRAKNSWRQSTAARFFKQIAKEVLEECVYEPIVGEWLLTMLWGLKDGSGQELGKLRRGDRENFQGIIGSARTAAAYLWHAFMLEFNSVVQEMAPYPPSRWFSSSLIPTKMSSTPFAFSSKKGSSKKMPKGNFSCSRPHLPD